jgi:arylsulfatase A-like enzyme
LLGLLDVAIRRFASPSWRFGCALAMPAAILAATEILLVENFTYTILGFNVGSTAGALRLGYGLFFLLLFAGTYRALDRWCETRPLRRRSALALAAALVLVVGSAGLAAVRARSAPGGAATGTAALAARSIERPNVLILVADAVRSRSMSAYGYARETTPFIDSLVPESLVFENHFTNSATTTGAVATLLSGKLPTHTRLIYRPDVFTGVDVYQHLPGVLRGLGYHNADISVRHFADAYDLNLRDGFHYANLRSLADEDRLLPLPRSLRVAYPAESLFLEQSGERIRGRILHAFAIEDMVDPYAEVTQLKGGPYFGSDDGRIKQLLRFIDGVPEPFFAHVHLMGTHGKSFHPKIPVYSLGKEQKRNWMRNFYDDAIADFDRYVEELVGELEATGKLDRTILILNSDHGMHWDSAERLPLIIRFPGGSPNGRVSANTQRIDIAPTILDDIGMEVPEWMVGRSLISDELDPKRPVIATHQRSNALIDGQWQVEKPRSPFYTLGGVSAIICQQYYHLWFQNPNRIIMQTTPIKGHTAPCPEEELPSRGLMRLFIVDHLEDNGYDVSTLRTTTKFPAEGSSRF